MYPSQDTLLLEHQVEANTRARNTVQNAGNYRTLVEAFLHIMPRRHRFRIAGDRPIGHPQHHKLLNIRYASHHSSRHSRELFDPDHNNIALYTYNSPIIVLQIPPTATMVHKILFWSGFGIFPAAHSFLRCMTNIFDLFRDRRPLLAARYRNASLLQQTVTLGLPCVRSGRREFRVLVDGCVTKAEQHISRAEKQLTGKAEEKS